MQNKFFDSSLPKCCSQVKPRTQNGSKEQVLTPDPRQRGLQRVLRDITTLTFSYIQHPSHLTHLQHIPLPALPPDPRLSTDSSEQPPSRLITSHHILTRLHNNTQLQVHCTIRRPSGKQMHFISYDDDDDDDDGGQRPGKPCLAFGGGSKKNNRGCRCCIYHRDDQLTWLAAQLTPRVPGVTWAVEEIDLNVLAPRKCIGLLWVRATPGPPGCQGLYLITEQPLLQ